MGGKEKLRNESRWRRDASLDPVAGKTEPVWFWPSPSLHPSRSPVRTSHDRVGTLLGVIFSSPWAHVLGFIGFPPGKVSLQPFLPRLHV